MPTQSSFPSSTTPTTWLRPLFKVLLVDDVASLRLLLRLAFTTEPYAIYEAGTGQAALEMFFELKPDLVLLDLSLPDMNGAQVLQQMRQVDQSVPILIVSAASVQTQQVVAMTYGANGFIAKPFNLLTIRRMVAKHLAHDTAHSF